MTDLLTVGELKRQLEGLDDSDKLHLPGGLSFYGLKRVADDEFCIEPNEPQAFISDDFKKRNPNIKVAFISADDVHWSEDGTVSEPINIELT